MVAFFISDFIFILHNRHSSPLSSSHSTDAEFHSQTAGQAPGAQSKRGRSNDMSKGVKIMFAIKISIIIKIWEWIPLYKAGNNF